MKQNTPARPFVKWAGGKANIITTLQNNLPETFREKSIYVEPFVGGGAMLFHILEHYPNIKKAIANDLNTRLINVYKAIQSSPKALIERLIIISQEYSQAEDKSAYYYNARDIFNNEKTEGVEDAALFIFLNKTCYNGLFRESANGKFNVPFGKRGNVIIFDRDNILKCSKLLRKVEFISGDYAATRTFATPDAFFYLDPPYRPIKKQSFTSYNKGQFNDREQLFLKTFCDNISDRGASFMQSNSDGNIADPPNTFLDDIYAEYNIERILANRSVGSGAHSRGLVSEILIKNY